MIVQKELMLRTRNGMELIEWMKEDDDDDDVNDDMMMLSEEESRIIEWYKEKNLKF